MQRALITDNPSSVQSKELLRAIWRRVESPYFRCAVKNLKQMYARTGMKRSFVGKRKKFFMIIATKIIAKKCTCMRRDITKAEEGVPPKLCH